MSLSERFAEFFAAVNPRGGDGEYLHPYPWQCDLVERVAREGHWPDIAVPTGAGKTSVIEAHVFLVAEHAAWMLRNRDADDDGAAAIIVRPPRRLVLIAPRRVLVDDQYEHAIELAKKLRDAEPGSAIGHVADLLRRLQTIRPGEADRDPLPVWRLRGGAARVDDGWRLDPAACQIICATPQMWGSRLLFRGYGASPNARNTETGLIAYDAVAVVDEAHLHERLLETGRRIAKQPWGSRRLQVVGMSATSRHVEGELTLSGADYADPDLARRVFANKQIVLREVVDLKREGERAVVNAAREAKADGTVGVFVNDVASALKVAGDLRQTGNNVVLVCGRMRPVDLARLRKNPDESSNNLLTPVGDPKVDYLVSTQSLEVGVDLDLPVVVTMIASANALAQRAGRLNRSGNSEPATFTVISQKGLADLDAARDQDVSKAQRSGPYDGVELIRAACWLRDLDGSIAPARVNELGLPEVRSSLLPALRQVDLETLQMTSMRQAADPDVDLYIEDPERRQLQIRVAARDHLEFAPDVVADVLEKCPPRAHELAPLPWSLGTRALQRFVARADRWATEHGCRLWAVRSRSGELAVEPVAKFEDLAAGDTLVVPAGVPMCTSGVVDLGGGGEPYGDVLKEAPDEAPHDRVIALAVADVQGALTLDSALRTKVSRAALADVVQASGDLECAARLRNGRRADTDLWWRCADDAERGLLVVLDLRWRARTTRSSGPEKVIPIGDHEARVRQRVKLILDKLLIGVGGREEDALLLAASMHDEGKRHPAFQRRMGWEPGMVPVAKPYPGHRPEPGDGWRHEQLSVVYVAAKSGLDHLAVLLVAAHHGRGRALFNRGIEDLLEGFDDCTPELRAAAEGLFGDFGHYELLRAKATRKYGAYELAWLEALLRCADVQISKEEED
jgi:CRISPR-associated endonuclease/helicase Cas3